MNFDPTKKHDVWDLLLDLEKAAGHHHDFHIAVELAHTFIKPLDGLPITKRHAAGLRFLKTLAQATRDNVHSRKTVSVGVLSCDAHYVKGYALLAQRPAMARVIRPHLETLLTVNVCTGSPM